MKTNLRLPHSLNARTILPWVSFLLGVWLGRFPDFTARAGDEGFTAIFDKDHQDGWKYIGEGEMTVRDGVASTPSREGPKFGLYWFWKKPFADFALRLEYSVDSARSNSGILVRFPNPGDDYDAAANRAYEIDIFGEKTGTIVHAAERARPTKIVPQHAGGWNELEVTAIGQKYVVKLNGEVVNEFTGSLAVHGYIGLQYWKGDGGAHFRNVHIREIAAPSEPRPGDGPTAAAVANPRFIEILSEQAPNALEWALAPLDRTTPPDIRQNLTVLRENLLDESAKSPSASPEAYKLGQVLCNDLIATLNERDRAVVRAGYTAAQAEANIAIRDQSLEARRNYQMRWPQYFRERDQRKELRQEKEDAAGLARQRPALEWADRGALIRKNVDLVYGQFREAARRPAPPK